MAVVHSLVGQTTRTPNAISLILALSILNVRREVKYIPTEPRNMKKGKVMTQRLPE